MIQKECSRRRRLLTCLFACLVGVAGAAVADDRDLLRERAGEPFVFVIFDTSSSMSSTPPCTRDQAFSDMDPFDGMCTTECPLGNAACARVCPDLGCREYDFSSFSTTGLTVRDEDTATLTPNNGWDQDSADTATGNDFLHDGFLADADPELKSATYDPNLADGGDYMIFLWWPQDADADGDGLGDSFASNTLVDIEHASGTATMAIDQRLDGGRWNHIGTWNMAPGTGQVTIRNESGNGKVVADTVGWLGINLPGCVDGEQVYRCQQPICPRGSCYASLNGDDPTSKFFQAKQALFEAMTATSNTQFGFATYEQDNPRLRAKHWLYRVRSIDNSGVPHQLPTLDGTPFIEAGDHEVFGNYSLDGAPNPGATLGDGFNCVTGADDDQRVGCEFSYPADLSDPWEARRARRIPKAGREGDLSTEAWYRLDHDDDQIYKVLYNPSGVDVNLGADVIRVTVDITLVTTTGECGNGVCEISAGENCNTCADDCNGVSRGKPHQRGCCGAIDCGGDNPIDCSDPRCIEGGVTCTEEPTLVETPLPIPAIQSSSADKIFLSSFVPFPDESFWSGRIDAFRKPLPLTPEKRPDVGRKCVNVDDASASLQSGCHIWEAGTMLCEQAPEAADAAAGNFQLGSDPAAQRRVVYGLSPSVTVPNSLRLFDIPAIPATATDPLDAITEDLLEAIDPDEVTAWNLEQTSPAALEEIFQEVIGGTLGIKVIDPSYEDDVEGCELSGGGEGYILGDVFHANPVSIASPDNFTYLANNQSGYREFARKHAWRRRMLAAATNDGQLHFIDSGVRQFVLNTFTSDPDDRIEVFNDGSGHELFSYIPRFALSILKAQTTTDQHIFSVDNTLAVGDVYIDPIGDTEDDRQWRTVVIGSLREGGDIFQESAGVSNFKGGYFALDVTQPDLLNPRTAGSDPTWVPCPADDANCDQDTFDFDSEYTPSCLEFFTSSAGTQSTPAGCEFAFPAELWTFDDSVAVPGVAGTFYLDEDSNGIADLADSWSRPVIGQIEVCATDGGECDPGDPGADDDLQSLHVAIFTGGMDARRKGDSEVAGNYLYMVDIETGEAIYKRQLEGSAPADPAVLDIDRDGFFDRVYVGTAAGKVYKIDLDARNASTGLVPGFDDPAYAIDENHLVSLDEAGDPTRFTSVPGTAIDPPIESRRISDSAWDPFVILDTGGTPIYHAPAAFFINERNQYGLAVGTGDREDLWAFDNGEPVSAPTDPVGGRFIVLVDEDFENDAAAYSATECDSKLPVTSACLEAIAFTDTPDLAADYLLRPADDPNNFGFKIRPGWVLTVTPQTRITSEAFVVAGVLIFSAFEAVVERLEDGGEDFCAQTGMTRAFVVALNNAGPIAPLGLEGAAGSGGETTAGERDIDRYHEISEFTTAPFIDSTSSKNPEAEGDTILGEIDDAVAASIRQALVSMFPRGSRFNKNFSLVIAALRNSTGVNVYATIPIAIYPADWRGQ